MNLKPLLERSSRDHSHLCPRQILGARMGLYGIKTLQLEPNCSNKRLFVIAETDGCFIDGISAATNCAIGHRTLRAVDYGKVAASFIDTQTNHAVRIAPALDIRERADIYAPTAPSRYLAQMQAYQSMPDDEMFTIQYITLNINLAQIVSNPELRVHCQQCGEEVMNEREVRQNGMTLCRACTGITYYELNAVLSYTSN
jgi:formylmethanofuran dehydrogenase subunit E